MKLVQLNDKNGNNIYVNPERVTYIEQQRNGVLIVFDSAGSSFDRIQVLGNVDWVAEQLNAIEDK